MSSELGSSSPQSMPSSSAHTPPEERPDECPERHRMKVEQETGQCDQDDDLLRGISRLDDMYTAGDGIDQTSAWNVWDSNSKGDQAYFFSRHEKCEW
jgi:hypothetical protein